MKYYKINKLNSKGFSLHYLFPLIVIVVIAIAGVRILNGSHASSPISTKLASQTTSCVAPTNYPGAPNGGMTYVNWTFNHPDINSLTNSVKLVNNPGVSTQMFLQLYDFNIDNTAQYYGMQTSGLILWSEFGTSNPSNAIAGAGSTIVVGSGEGNFVSLRHSFGSLPAGSYTTKVYRTTSTSTGDWFAYYVSFPGKSSVYVGSLLFPRAMAGVRASFKDGGGTWIEDYQNNGSVLYPVPVWNVTIGIKANGTVVPIHARSAYSAMPNSNIKNSVTKGSVNMVVGGSTPRCTPAGNLY